MSGTRGALGAACLACFAANVAADELEYRNSRFGTQITVPADIFTIIDQPPGNGDGRRFRSADGATLSVYGQHNALDLTPAALVAKARDEAEKGGREVTYAVSKENWAVISGLKGQTIFYERHEFGRDGVIHSMVLDYPQDRKSVYNPLTGAIAATLEGP